MSQVVSKEILEELLALTRESYVMFEKLIEAGIQSESSVKIILVILCIL